MTPFFKHTETFGMMMPTLRNLKANQPLNLKIFANAWQKPRGRYKNHGEQGQTSLSLKNAVYGSSNSPVTSWKDDAWKTVPCDFPFSCGQNGFFRMVKAGGLTSGTCNQPTSRHCWTANDLKNSRYEFPSTLHLKPATVAFKNGTSLCFPGSLPSSSLRVLSFKRHL